MSRVIKNVNKIFIGIFIAVNYPVGIDNKIDE